MAMNTNNMSAETLSEIFSAVGKEYGYETVSAVFSNFRDFKVRWQRSYKWADFKVSDYCESMSEDAMRGLATTLFERIYGNDVPYSDKMAEEVMDDSFSKKHQRTYIKRAKTITGTTVGNNHNLADSVARLKLMTGADGEPLQVAKNNTHIAWSNKMTNKTGTASSLMRVVAINKKLDDSAVPEDVIDYAVYKHILQVNMGFRVDGMDSAPLIANALSNFPNASLAEDYLNRHCIY